MNRRYWSGLAIASFVATLTGPLIAAAAPEEGETAIPVLCPPRLPGMWSYAQYSIYQNWGPHSYSIERDASAPEGDEIHFITFGQRLALGIEASQPNAVGQGWYLPDFRGPVPSDGHTWWWEVRGSNRLRQPSALWKCDFIDAGPFGKYFALRYLHQTWGFAFPQRGGDEYAIEAPCTEDDDEEDDDDDGSGGDDGAPPPTDGPPDNDNPGGQTSCVGPGGSDSNQYCYEMYLYWIDGDGDYHEILIDEWCQSTPIETGYAQL